MDTIPWFYQPKYLFDLKLFGICSDVVKIFMRFHLNCFQNQVTMKFPYLFCFLMSSSLWILACSTPKQGAQNSSTPSTEMAYDSVLAARLGADQYGMHKYVVAFLKAGPNRSQDSTTAAALQRAHMDNIFRMAEEGKLVVAGPFMDGGELRGIYIFNVETVEEARALTDTDPAVKAGRLIMELHPWYGSAAMQMINEWHGKIQKKQI
jgi:uncharacterized protein YciI